MPALTAEESDFISVSTQQRANSEESLIDFQVDISAGRNSNCQVRRGSVTLRGPAGAGKIISIEQGVPASCALQGCEDAVFANPSVNLDEPIALLEDGGTSTFRLRDIPARCTQNNLRAENLPSFVNVAARKITSSGQVDFEVRMTADENNTCQERRGSFRLSIGEAQKTISIEQGMTHFKRLACSSGPIDTIISLDLSGENISELRQSFFEGFTRLEELDLSQNSIRVLGTGTFSPLTRLKELDLSENQIHSIADNVFSSSLGELDLSQNQIRSLSSSMLAGLTRLEELDLNGNQISSISQNTFSGLSNLKYLWLNSNNIASLPESVFNSLTRLRVLALDANALTSLPEDVFQNLSNLRYLWLNANNITNLPSNIFSDLSRLRYLNLSYNNLGPLPDSICTILRNLRYLVIQGSSMDTLCPEGGSGGVNSTSLWKKFSFKRLESSFMPQIFLDEETVHPDVILKMHQDGVSVEDISQITGTRMDVMHGIIGVDL